MIRLPAVTFCSARTNERPGGAEPVANSKRLARKKTVTAVSPVEVAPPVTSTVTGPFASSRVFANSARAEPPINGSIINANASFLIGPLPSLGCALPAPGRVACSSWPRRHVSAVRGTKR
jgi:hypothetical protein